MQELRKSAAFYFIVTSVTLTPTRLHGLTSNNTVIFAVINCPAERSYLSSQRGTEPSDARCQLCTALPCLQSTDVLYRKECMTANGKDSQI